MKEYIDKVYTLISDYRNSDNIYLDINHIKRWLSQFDINVRLPIIRELSHIIENCYFSRDRVRNILNNIIFSKQLCGDDINSFWENITILNIQQAGSSQKDIIDELSTLLKLQLNINNIKINTSNSCLLYIDDFLYHGNRIYRDIQSLLPALNDGTFIHIVVIGAYKYGLYKTENRLNDLISSSNKNIKFRIWKCIELENRQNNLGQCDVYYPSSLPNHNIINYILSTDKFPFNPRQQNVYRGRIFNNETDRQIIEEQFLLAGCNIISSYTTPSSSMRPLGISGYGLGFGTPIVTYRNCPNNSPLALWWGNYPYDENNPFNQFYPLFPRKTN